jgi:hypothetical protein
VALGQDGRHSAVQNDISLTGDEIDNIVRWADRGRHWAIQRHAAAQAVAERRCSICRELQQTAGSHRQVDAVTQAAQGSGSVVAASDRHRLDRGPMGDGN